MDVEIKVPSVQNPERVQESLLKPEVGQNIATYASPTSKNFSLSTSYPPGPFDFIIPKPLPASDMALNSKHY